MHSDYSPATCPSLFDPPFPGIQSLLRCAYGISCPTIGSSIHCNAYKILKYPSAQELKGKIFQPFGMRSQLQELSKLCGRAWKDMEKLRGHIRNLSPGRVCLGMFTLHGLCGQGSAHLWFHITVTLSRVSMGWKSQLPPQWNLKGLIAPPTVSLCAWSSTHSYQSSGMKQCFPKRPLLLRKGSDTFSHYSSVLI